MDNPDFEKRVYDQVCQQKVSVSVNAWYGLLYRLFMSPTNYQAALSRELIFCNIYPTNITILLFLMRVYDFTVACFLTTIIQLVSKLASENDKKPILSVLGRVDMDSWCMLFVL